MKLRIGLLLLLPAALFGQLSPELTSSYWQDPDFRDRFMQTYGTRGEIEPKVNQEEAAILQQIMPQLEASNYRLAINTLQAQITPQSSAALDMVLGNLYFQEGNVSAARQAYREAIRKFPNFLRAHQNLGILEVQNGNFETAIPLLSKTIEMGIADGDTYGLLAYSFLNQGQYGSAESAYRQALLLDPNNPDWKNGLINALLENSKPGEAIAIIEEVIAKDPSKPEFWMVQANAYLAMDDRQKAIANLEMVRRLGKADAQSLMLLGDLYMSGEMADLALTVYKEAIEQDGEITADKAMRSAEVLLSQANYDEALEYS
ncbi:MAG: tetratricopeptide repeat protein, partial [Verrucomicrobiota bacterium]